MYSAGSADMSSNSGSEPSPMPSSRIPAQPKWSCSFAALSEAPAGQLCFFDGPSFVSAPDEAAAERFPKKPMNDARAAVFFHLDCLARHRHDDHGTFNLRRSNAPSGQCCGALRARRGAQKVTAQRVRGGARKALLEDRGNESKRLRHKKIRHSRAGHINVCFDSKIRRPYADVRPCMVVYSG